MLFNRSFKLANAIILLFMCVYVSKVSAAVLVNETTKISVVEQSDVAQIEALMTSYQDILNNKNVDNVKTVYTADAQFIGDNFPTATGVNNINALYGDFLSKLDFNIRFEILEVALNKDFGFIQTISTGSISPKGNGSPKGALAGNEEANREIFIVKKITNEWQIYRYIFTAELK
ncbi:hypothetical protein [Moritella sp. F3]|uniref:YybH family protein n=1 Tax=Moritella sp. F3 TaxID=2718882 RepID=UPI0018E162BE|nr:hypothetical protein [Moritella sp. F3]GIC75455.1 hypothetical protein FMO001_01820 [Moritella sp. F1]GIC80600.1 hypothetical protein FMO003_08810 [Moritella sp. F3]